MDDDVFSWLEESWEEGRRRRVAMEAERNRNFLRTLYGTGMTFVDTSGRVAVGGGSGSVGAVRIGAGVGTAAAGSPTLGQVISRTIPIVNDAIPTPSAVPVTPTGWGQATAWVAPGTPEIELERFMPKKITYESYVIPKGILLENQPSHYGVICVDEGIGEWAPEYRILDFRTEDEKRHDLKPPYRANLWLSQGAIQRYATRNCQLSVVCNTVGLFERSKIEYSRARLNCMLFAPHTDVIWGRNSKYKLLLLDYREDHDEFIWPLFNKKDIYVVIREPYNSSNGSKMRMMLVNVSETRPFELGELQIKF